MRYTYLLFLLFTGFSFSESNDPNKPLDIDGLKINQIQVIASHNSYHLRTDRAMLRYLHNLYALHILPRDLNPQEIDYSNASLTDQLEKYHLRGLELDVWNDPKGGHFYHRQGRAFILRRTASGIAALKEPGFKLLHIPDFDYNATNPTFKAAITEIKKWSDSHPGHLPVFINVETEVSTPGDQIHQLHRLTKAVPFDSAAADNLDKEVKSVFGDDLNGVITPDQVRGNYETLEKAALAGNWPTLKTARGKVIFIIDGDGNSGDVYKVGHPSLKRRVMFVYSNPGTPEAAFVIRNNPSRKYDQIQELVQKGYIVRTRCDAGTTQARLGDYSQMQEAFDSWGQICSTDYYRPDPRAGKKGWTSYHVAFPNGELARVDSMSAPPQMRNAVIKESKFEN